MPDHMHLLGETDARFGVHRQVKALKWSSSLLRGEFSWPLSLRANAYFFAAVCGVPSSVIKRYIDMQKDR
jgi:putative transposase